MRTQTLLSEKIDELCGMGVPPKAISEILGCSINQVYGRRTYVEKKKRDDAVSGERALYTIDDAWILLKRSYRLVEGLEGSEDIKAAFDLLDEALRSYKKAIRGVAGKNRLVKKAVK